MLFSLIISVFIFVFLHLGFIAVTAVLFGVGIREFSYGYGLVITRIGRFCIKAIPLGGYVGFVNSNSYEEDENSTGDYAKMPLFIQTLIAMSGCAALLLLIFIVDFELALGSLISAFEQIIFGALSPLKVAQEYLSVLNGVFLKGGFEAIFVLVCAKGIALNLLPLPSTNFGHVVHMIIRKSSGGSGVVQNIFNMFSVIYLAISASWCVAFAVFIYNSI